MAEDKGRRVFIRKTITCFGRYVETRPRGFYVDRDGYFRLDNLIEVWGHGQDVSEEEVVDAVRSGMHQRSSTYLRFDMRRDQNSRRILKVYPKGGDRVREDRQRSTSRRRGRSRSPRPTRMLRTDSTRSLPIQLGRGDRSRISHTLSSLLRHRTVEEGGVGMDSSGWCCLDEVLRTSCMQYHRCTSEMIHIVVEQCEKSRFEVFNGYIRALQGHSRDEVVSENLMVRLNMNDELPQYCIHGTYERNRRSIQRYGLSTQGRNHIHFTYCLPARGQLVSGVRSNCDLAVYIDLRRAIADGIPFYRSHNNVILTPGINGVLSSRYIWYWENLW